MTPATASPCRTRRRLGRGPRSTATATAACGRPTRSSARAASMPVDAVWRASRPVPMATADALKVPLMIVSSRGLRAVRGGRWRLRRAAGTRGGAGVGLVRVLPMGSHGEGELLAVARALTAGGVERGYGAHARCRRTRRGRRGRGRPGSARRPPCHLTQRLQRVGLGGLERLGIGHVGVNTTSVGPFRLWCARRMGTTSRMRRPRFATFDARGQCADGQPRHRAAAGRSRRHAPARRAWDRPDVAQQRTLAGVAGEQDALLTELLICWIIGSYSARDAPPLRRARTTCRPRSKAWGSQSASGVSGLSRRWRRARSHRRARRSRDPSTTSGCAAARP